MFELFRFGSVATLARSSQQSAPALSFIAPSASWTRGVEIVAELRDYEVAFNALNGNLNELYGVKPPKHMKALIGAVENFVAREEAARAAATAAKEEAARKEGAKRAPSPAPAPNPVTGAKITVRALMKELGLSSRSLTSERLSEALTLGFIEIVDIGHAYGKTETKRYRVLTPSEDIDEEVIISILPKPEDVGRRHKERLVGV